MTWPFGKLQRGGFDFVMIDCAWPFEVWSAAGAEKSPQAQYDCQSWEEIHSLPVRDLLRGHGGGAVWVWGTWPLLARGDLSRVLDSWGLFGKTGGDWAKRTRTGKLRWGPGKIIRTVCEPFIIATTSPRAEVSLRGPSCKNLIETMGATSLGGLAREHSRKPDEAYRICEQLMPDAVRADVYSRQRRRPGWQGFGRELGKFQEERR